jgi:hypothetical protein
MTTTDLIKAMNKNSITVYLKNGQTFRGEMVKNDLAEMESGHVNLYDVLTGKFFSCHKDNVNCLLVDE